MRTLSFEILRRVSLVALGAIALTGAAGCKINVSGGDGDGVCEYNGETYDAGESFPSTDGCNSCFCDENGGVGCTEKACIDTCEWEGQLYEVGQSFPAGDGCNTCSCESDGQVACTLIGCVAACEYLGESYEVGDVFPAGDNCNTCTCLEPGEVACSIGGCTNEQCSYEGFFHEPGDTWLSNDQCTSCTCVAGGNSECVSGVTCTTCYYTGELHQSGESFPSVDGCNTCTCDGGGVACTEIACACNPEGEWYRDYVGDPESCQVIDYVCPDGTTSFFNECGCGCEQPTSCPKAFDCMPPSACDIQSLQQLCPYSGIAL